MGDISKNHNQSNSEKKNLIGHFDLSKLDDSNNMFEYSISKKDNNIPSFCKEKTALYSMSTYCSGGPSSEFDSNIEEILLFGDFPSVISYAGSCPGINGVEDQTNQEVDLKRGQIYEITITWGTCANIWPGAGSAWIDWDQSISFEPTELIAEWEGTPVLTETYTFTVPTDAALGETRLRVMQEEFGNLPLDPCEVFSWGAVVDFTVNVIDDSSPDCPDVAPCCQCPHYIIEDGILSAWMPCGDEVWWGHRPLGNEFFLWSFGETFDLDLDFFGTSDGYVEIRDLNEPGSPIRCRIYVPPFDNCSNFEIPNAHISSTTIQDPPFTFYNFSGASSENYCNFFWSGLLITESGAIGIESCEFSINDEDIDYTICSGCPVGGSITYETNDCFTVENDLGFSRYCMGGIFTLGSSPLPKLNPTLNGADLSFSVDPNYDDLSTATSIQWDMGDGTQITGNGPLDNPHTYTTQGKFVVCVDIEFSDGSSICICWTVEIDCPPNWPICQCPLIYDPVCTPNGQLFTNSCFAECAGYTNHFPSMDGSCVNLCQQFFDYDNHLAPRTFDFTYLTYAEDIQYFTVVRDDDPVNTLQVVEVNDISDLIFTCPSPGEWTFCFYHCTEDPIIAIGGGENRNIQNYEGFSSCCDIEVCCITVCADQDPLPVECGYSSIDILNYPCFNSPIHDHCVSLGLVPYPGGINIYNFNHQGGGVSINIESNNPNRLLTLKIYEGNNPYAIELCDYIYLDATFCSQNDCSIQYANLNLPAGEYLIVLIDENFNAATNPGSYNIWIECLCDDYISGQQCASILPSFVEEQGNTLLFSFEVENFNLPIEWWEIDGVNQFIGGNNQNLSFDYFGSEYQAEVCFVYWDDNEKCWRRCCRTVCIVNPFDCGSVDYEWLPNGDIRLTVNQSFQSGTLEWILDNHEDGPTVIGSGNNLEIDLSQFPIEGDDYLISARYGTADCWRYCCIAVPVPPSFECNKILYVVTENGLGANFEQEDGIAGNWLVIEENGDTINIAFDVAEAAYYNPIGGIREVCWWQQNPDGSFEYCCRTFCCFDAYFCDFVLYNEITFDSDQVNFAPDITTGQYWIVTNTETGESEQFNHEPNLIIEYPGNGFYEVCGYFINSCGELQWCCYTRCVAPPTCELWYSPPVVLPLGGIEVEFTFPPGITVDSIVITSVDDPDFEHIVSDIPPGTISLIIELPDYGDYDFCYYYIWDVRVNANTQRAFTEECCRRISLNPCPPIWYAPVGSGDWVYRIENQGDNPVHQWEIADENGNVINLVNGNDITYDFGSAGEYIITPLVIIPDDCSIVRGCSERLCLTPVFDCDVIFQRPTPVFLQGGVLRYTFDFVGPAGAEHIQWYVDENPNMRAEGQTVFFDFGPEFFGTHVTISVIWFDGHCWRVCCIRICIADPFACDVIEFDPVPLPEGLQLDFNLPSNFVDVYWELHLTDGTTIATGQGNQWSHLLTEFDNEELVISVTYFDPVTGCRKMCCELLCLPDPLACEDIVVQPMPFGYSGGDYGYSAQLLTQNATDISWYWHDADGNILGSGFGATAEFIFDSDFEGEVFITFIYRQGNCWRVCCKRICVRNPWQCGNLLWSIAGIGQNTVSYNFVFEDLPADAEDVEWEILDENGNVFASGSGAEFTENLTQGQTFIILYRYFDPVLNCRVICCRRLCVLDPFACNNILYDWLSGGTITLTLDDDFETGTLEWILDNHAGGPIVIGTGNNLTVDLGQYQVVGSEYEISARYRKSGCWRFCCAFVPFPPSVGCVDILYTVTENGLGANFEREDGIAGNWLVIEENGDTINIAFDVAEAAYYNPIGGIREVCWWQQNPDGSFEYCCRTFCCFDAYFCDFVLYNEITFDSDQVNFAPDITTGEYWIVTNTETGESEQFNHEPNLIIEYPGNGFYEVCGYFINSCGELQWCCYTRCVAPPTCELWYSPPVVLPLGGIEVEFTFPPGITVDSIVITSVDDPDFEHIVSDIPPGTISLIIELPDYGDYDFCYYYTNDVFINSKQSRAIVEECCRRIYLNPCPPIWYAPVGSGDWVYRIENQGDNPVHQWEIADENGNVIDMVNGNDIVYDFGSAGEYIITPLVIIPDDCSIVRGCSERLCLTPVFDCDVIFQRLTPVFLQGGVLRYTFDFVDPAGAKHIQWYVDENPNMRAEGQTVFFDFGPEFFGTHVTISVIWFDGHCWRVCCIRICIADPFACDVIEFDPVPLPEGLQLDFSLSSNFVDVYWELHLTDGTTIATGQGNQWSHLLTEFDNEELVISVTYFDPVTGCRKMCCELLCLPDPLACEDIVVQPMPFGYSGGDYGYQAQLFTPGATDISWYWHDADGNILSSGFGATAEFIFDSDFEGEVFITFIYRQGNCWRVCCKRICVRNPWQCGNLLWSIAGIGQNTVSYNFVFEDLPADAEDVEWEILDENGNVFASGSGAEFTESLTQGQTFIIVYRYFDPVLNCRVICCRRLCVLDPFACGDIIVYPKPVPGGPVYIAELLNPDAEDIYWQVDEDLSNNQTGGTTFEVDFGQYPPGSYNITVRYRIGDCWFMCCRQLCISPPLNCSLLSAESAGGLLININNPENLPIEEYFVFDQSEELIETLDGNSTTFELPQSGSYTFCGYYFVNGCWNYCCFIYNDCDSQIHCDDFVFSPSGNQGEVNISGQLTGGVNVDSVRIIQPDNSSIWISGNITEYQCPQPGDYQFCFYYINECGFVDFCCVTYCADNFDYPCMIGPAVLIVENEYVITYEGTEEVAHWEINGEQTGDGLQEITVIIDDPGEYEICVIRISPCGRVLERCCVTYCLGGQTDCTLPVWEVFENDLQVSFSQLNSDSVKVYNAENDEPIESVDISGLSNWTVNLPEQGNYYFCFSYVNACGFIEFCCTEVICVGVLPLCPPFETAISELSVDFSFPSPPSGTAMWDFGDGNTGSGNQITHVYEEGGSYTVCYTIINDCGSCSYCETIVIFPEDAIALAYGKIITRPDRIVEVPLYVASGTTLARGFNLTMRVEDQSVVDYLGFNSVANFTFSNVGETSPGSGDYVVLLGTIGEPIVISRGDTLGYFRFDAIGQPGDTTAIEFIRSENNTIEDNSAPPQFIEPILIDGCVIISEESISFAGQVTSWPSPEIGINNAEVFISSGISQIGSSFTGVSGEYSIANLIPPSSGNMTFNVEKTAAEPFQALVGQVQAAAVTRHINQNDFVHQGQYIAADFNCDGLISVGDVLSIMQAAFNINDETLTPECRERDWIFVPKAHEVSPVNNDNWYPFSESIDLSMPLIAGEADFFGIRKGDVLNFSNFGRSAPLVFYTSDSLVSQGEYVMELKVDNFRDISSFGFTLDFDTTQVEFLGFSQDNFRGSPLFHDSDALQNGRLSLGWVDLSGNGINIDNGNMAFSMHWRIKDGNSLISSVIQDANAETAVGTKSDLELLNVVFRYDHILSSESDGQITQFALHQNIPNPYRGSTIIPFEIPQRSQVILEIFDSKGNLVYRYSDVFPAGLNHHLIEGIRPAGTYFYRLQADGHSAVKKMIVISE